MVYFINKVLLWFVAMTALEIALIGIGKLTGSGWHSRNFDTGIIFKIALILDGYLTVMLCKWLLWIE